MTSSSEYAHDVIIPMNYVINDNLNFIDDVIIMSITAEIVLKIVFILEKSIFSPNLLN